MKVMRFLIVTTALLASPFALGHASAADDQHAAAAIQIPPPPAGKGQIVFFRPSAMGMLIGCTVHEGDQTISRLGNGHYFIHVTEPGKHTYTVQSEAKDVLNVEVEPDESQYVRCRISMGIMAGRPNLSPASKEDFDKKAGGLKLEKPAAAQS